jgi:hypothetical protein
MRIPAGAAALFLLPQHFPCLPIAPAGSRHPLRWPGPEEELRVQKRLDLATEPTRSKSARGPTTAYRDSRSVCGGLCSFDQTFPAALIFALAADRTLAHRRF